MRVINASEWLTQNSENSSVLIYSANGKFKPEDVCFEKYYQAFSFAYHAQASNEITAYRDHFGLEPFYYCYQPPYFIFGSSIVDILKKLSTTPNLNEARILAECFSCTQLSFPYSDETYYQGVYRLAPGTCLRIKNNKLQLQTFWQPDAETPYLQYANDCTYVEHFTQLLHEAVQSIAQNHKQIATECSGGLDSTAVITACQHLNISATLLSHVAPKDKQGQDDDLPHIQSLIKHFALSDIHYLDATEFDPIAVFQYCAQLFAGPAPFLFFMLANNVHQAAHHNNATLLLSGFGGDECVSSHAIPRAFFPELLAKRNYRTAWHEMQRLKPSESSVKIFSNLLKFQSPWLYRVFNKIVDMKRLIKNHQIAALKKPYCKNIREFEIEQLTNRALRLRIEYSAVIAKNLGFQYGYPLLHPKLIEFALALPPEQKRRDGVTRYLIRQYLANYLPPQIVNKQKIGGGIIPSTLQLCKEMLAQNKFAEHFVDLPFTTAINSARDERTLLKASIAAYMLKSYSCLQGN